MVNVFICIVFSESQNHLNPIVLFKSKTLFFDILHPPLHCLFLFFLSSHSLKTCGGAPWGLCGPSQIFVPREMLQSCTLHWRRKVQLYKCSWGMIVVVKVNQLVFFYTNCCYFKLPYLSVKDVSTTVRILTNRSNAQRRSLAQAYKNFSQKVNQKQINLQIITS